MLSVMEGKNLVVLRESKLRGHSLVPYIDTRSTDVSALRKGGAGEGGLYIVEGGRSRRRDNL